MTPPAPVAGRGFLAGLVGLTFLMNAIGRGVTETFAVFLLPVEAALDTGRAEIAATYAIYMLAYAAAAPFVGQIVDRLGARACYGLGLTSLGAGYMVAGAAPNIHVYWIGAGILAGIGAAALGMVAASSLLARWFSGRMGLVAALPYAAVGAGMLVFPPLAQVLSEQLGWRLAHTLLGAVPLAALLVLFVLPVRRYATGSSQWQALRSGSGRDGTGNTRTTTPWPLGLAVRTSAFRALFLAYFATSVAAYAVLPHSVAHLVERGFPPLAAAGAFGLTGVMSAVGIVAMGWTSDRIGRVPAATISYAVTIAGILSLMAAGTWGGTLPMYAFAVCFGLMQGARGPILVALVARIFAGGSVGAIFGTLSMALGLGAAAGSWLSGRLHEITGSYDAAFAVAIGACLVGNATFWLSRPIREASRSA
jgi:MFS family permease